MSVATDNHASELMQSAARETAFLAVMDALGCAFKALQDPACVKLLGALVPGATMAFGARVPGTSYQLDPVHAAFNVGTLVSWHGTCDSALASSCGHLADNLGAVIAVADYRSRKAIAEGAAPPTVQDLLTAVVDAHQYAMLEWTRRVRESEPDPAAATAPCTSAATRCAVTTVASAVTAASLFGGTSAHLASAAALARAELPENAHRPATITAAAGLSRWRIGDATSRGVRLALIALAVPPHDAGITDQIETMGSRAVLGMRPEFPWDRNSSTPDLATRVRDRFHACVTGHYPAAQAGKISALFAEDPARLQALSVSEFVSALVRN